MNDFRESSKKNWTTAGTVDHINAGSLQRIADACELMAKNFLKLQSERDWYADSYKRERSENDKLFRSNAALRGVITKLRRR